MNDSRPLTAYLIAGEASGDLLGAHLISAIRDKQPQIKVHGIGGHRMEAQRLKSLFPYHELSLMGFVEILPYMLKLAARINQTVEDICLKRPDIVITIDSPGFCFRVVQKLRQRNIQAKFVHYVAPSVWAYKPERAEKCARLFDHVLALLPFEPPYFTEVGLPCTFVGHPVIAETSTGDGAAFREKYGISAQTKLICLLPGSRKSEIRRHMPVFARAVSILASRIPDLAIAVTVPKYVLEDVAHYFEHCPFRAVITANEEDKKNAIAASHVAISKSGTVTLEVAMAGTPMVVAHRMNPLSAWMFRRQALIQHVNLINILAKKEIVPELLQENCLPPLLSTVAYQLISDPVRIADMKEGYRAELAKLIPPGNAKPSQLAADIILQLLNR